MISCNNCKKNLPLYIDGSLDREKKRDIDKHLQECEECREYSKELQSVNSQLESKDFHIDKEYGNQLLVEINDRIDEKEQSNLFRWSAAVSSLIIILVISFIGFNGEKQKVSNESTDFSGSFYNYLEYSDISDYNFSTGDYTNIINDQYSDMSIEIGYSMLKSSGVESFEEIYSITNKFSDERFNDLVINLRK